MIYLNIKKIIICFFFVFFWISIQSSPKVAAVTDSKYKLFKNSENFGILLFPASSTGDLSQYIKSLKFHHVESGKTVFRYGSKNENGTLMMPESVQKKYKIKKFIVIQILRENDFMIGIYDPDWGLTLPRARYSLADLQKNIPKTLRIFRGIESPMQETYNRTSPFFPGFVTILKSNNF